MYKSFLPHEARVSRRIPSKIDRHLQRSPYASLGVAMHLGVIRFKNSIKRLAR